ncbi:MAG TPA: valine--tRNA ligase, partial [Saprospiraceae bacterium]|nr:valine--tRNA ligase [Saprospiraceae bacterium]
LEAIKPTFGSPIDSNTYTKTIDLFEKMLTLLHPFMPFITEEIWHYIKERKDGDDCVVSVYPKSSGYDNNLLEAVTKVKSIVTKIRETRNSKGMKPKEPLKLFVEKSDSVEKFLFSEEIPGLKHTLKKMAFLSGVELVDIHDVDNTIPFMAANEKFMLEYNKEIDVEEEIAKLTKELEYQKGFVKSIEKKLSNESFVNNAPAAVVDKERKKLADGNERIKILEQSLASLKK